MLPMTMDESVESLQLPYDYVEAFPSRSSREAYSISASMKAASNSDSRVLRAVLARRLFPEPIPDRNIDKTKFLTWLREQRADTFGPNSAVDTPGQDPINSPLLQAVRSQLAENADLLLEAGANPNGIDIETQEIYQALFLRFRPSIPSYVDIDGDVADRERLLNCMELSQTAPITEEEVEDRSLAVSPFWTFESATTPDRFPKGNEMHSLVLAAQHSSTEMLDRLLEAGADTSSWTSKQGGNDSETSASLAVSSPLHAAIEARNVSMINHLLSRGFDPNFVPISTPLTCLTPLMSTFLLPNPAATRSESSQIDSESSRIPSSFNQDSYDALVSHPSTRFTITSPILSVHVFHLAAAHASLPLFKHILSTISLSPSYIPPTAIGQTLLHIACLPPSTSYINQKSLAATRSIHDTRSLEMPRIRPYVSRRVPGSLPEYSRSAAISNNEACGYFSAQTALVDFLIVSQHQKVAEQDLYGNNALHYLASHRVVNVEALDLLRAADSSNSAWNQAKNRWGYTAKDLIDQEEVSTGMDRDKIVNEYLAENTKAWRRRVMKRDRWWDERLAIEWRQHDKQVYDAEQLEHKTRQRGRSSGRSRGGRCGECGRRMPSQAPEFPYHVRQKSRIEA